ncbi:MAG: gliding motility-associated C-terminal domain-containing protein [Bacteroidales bacterium]
MNNEFKGQRTEDEVPGIITEAGKRNPYIVPEGYFEALPERVLSRIDSMEGARGRGRMIHIASRQWRAVAASVAVILFAGFTYALVSEVIIPAIRQGKTPDQDTTSVVTRNQIQEDISEDQNSTDEDQSLSPAPDNQPGYSFTQDGLLSSQGGKTGTSASSGVSQPDGQVRQTGSLLPGNTASSGTSGKPTSPPSPFAGRIADTTVCRGAFLVFQSGYHPALAEIHWSLNGKALSAGNASAASINTANLSNGNHQLSLVVSEKDGRNILKVSNATITVVAPPASRGTTKLCSYDKALLKTGPTNPYWVYQWSTGAMTPEITVTQTGKFWVTIRVPGTWCSITDTFDVKVMPKPSLNLGSDKTICSGDKINLIVKNPADQFTVKWTPGNSAGNEYLFEGKQPGTYRIRAEITGCTTVSDEIILRVIDCKLSIPNVFTPNGDGINDLLLIKGLEQYSGSRLVITDRNGKVVFESNDYRNDWDGSNQPNGTYFYLLLPGGAEDLARQGSLMILR